MIKYKLIFIQLIASLFNLFNNEKIHMFFSLTLVSLQFLSHTITMFPYIFFPLKNVKKKANRKHKLPSHSTRNLKYKKSYDQSSINAFLHKGLHENNGKLNMSPSEKYAFVRSFNSCSFVSSFVSFFSSETSDLFPAQENLVLLYNIIYYVIIWTC